MLLMGFAGMLFCGLALGYAICLLQRRTSRQITDEARERIEARVAAIGEPKKEKKKPKLRLVA